MRQFRHFFTFLLASLSFLPQLVGAQNSAAPAVNPAAPAQRIVILKVDGLNADLLYDTMRQVDPATGKSRLPWLSHVFGESGTVFKNFYTRGISLSAPSWSMLDTGQHAVIRGNVEYDRFTGQVYDYLNFFPFYIGYARKRAVDMPGVEVLDRAGIPLFIDRFQYPQISQSFQLFQRGVRWTTLQHALQRAFSGKKLLNSLETTGSTSFDQALAQETESQLETELKNPGVLYLDLFTGDIDHEGHATSDPAALFHELQNLDTLTGHIWSTIEKGPLAAQTLLVMVSDHGMNNVDGIISQTFSLPDLFNSPAGGGHHVVTDREQLSDYKLKGINPLVHRVISPSTASPYLSGQSSHYPTAWLDIDGNERASVHLRYSDLNKIHILLLQLARENLTPAIRKAAASDLLATIDRHRAAWQSTVSEMNAELAALSQAIDERKKLLGTLPHGTGKDGRRAGQDKTYLRLKHVESDWETEHGQYSSYVSHLQALLSFQPDFSRRYRGNISDLVPEMSLGDNNSVRDIQQYIVAPSPGGLVVSPDGHLDEAESFARVNYFPLLARAQARNNPQAAISVKPIDFIMMHLPDGRYAPDENSPQHAYWLYGDDDHQLVILKDATARITLRPVRNLGQDAAGQIRWSSLTWAPGLPLQLFEDPQLQIPPGTDRGQWLSQWHTEADWFAAIYHCRYSNGVIGVTEDLSPVADNVPGPPGTSPLLLRYEKKRRELVQADFEVFASDHWNFNVRFPNPGGNHGSFLRISMHSVWMMAGAGIPARQIEQPYDTLNFASTLLSLLGRTPPMPDRVVPTP